MISKNLIKYIRSFEQKKTRDREGLFVAEGPKVVGDLMTMQKPVIIVATDEWIRMHEDACGCKCTVATEDELRKTSFLQHPQQVLALFRIPDTNIHADIFKNELCLALDRIQDPGNLGTIIRIADWFGIHSIFCGEGTADAYNPKTVQASMGSIARVNIVYTNLCDMLDSLPAEVPAYATSLDGSDIYGQDLSKNGIIIMGNEGNGVSREIMDKVKTKLFIPNYSRQKGIDSLNVAIATAVICAEFRRRE